MKEIGGYIELDTYKRPMLHENAIALNYGRACLLYLIKTKQIKKIAIPYYLCEAISNLCKANDVEVSYYRINVSFKPCSISIKDDEWLYLVNYYGQLGNDYISEVVKKHSKVIVDNTQSYFSEPVKNVDTLYTCRKYFGVPDGAFLYTDIHLREALEYDVSYTRCNTY